MGYSVDCPYCPTAAWAVLFTVLRPSCCMGCSVYCSTAQLLHGLFCLLFYCIAAAWAFVLTVRTTQLLHGPFCSLPLPPSCCMGLSLYFLYRPAAAWVFVVHFPFA